MKKSNTVIWAEETLIPSLREKVNMMDVVPMVHLSRKQQEILERVAWEQGQGFHDCLAITYCGGYRLVQLNRENHTLWFMRTPSEDRLYRTISSGAKEKRILRNLEKAEADEQDALEEIVEAREYNDEEEVKRWTELLRDARKEMETYKKMLEAMGGE